MRSPDLSRSALVLVALLTLAAPARSDDQGLWRRWPGPWFDYSSLVVDAARHRLILVGGLKDGVANHVVWWRDLAPLSEWHGVRMPVASPRAIRNAALAVDPARDRVLVVAGDSASTAGETWAFDLATLSTWTSLAPTGGGPAPGSASCFVDPTLDRLVCVNASGLWTMALGTPPQWVAVSAGPRPADHYGSGYALDTQRHLLLAQGGNSSTWSRFSGSLWRDLWQLAIDQPDTAVWRLVNGADGPYRTGHRAFYDAARDRFVGHLGLSGWLSSASDSWELGLVSPWTVTTVANGIVNGPVTMDPPGDALLVMGGPQMWSAPLAGGAWTVRDTASYPDPNSFHPKAVYDARRHRLLVFGGGSSDQPLDDVWVLPLDSLPRWRPLAVTGTRPAARAGSAVALDEARDRLIVYGGYVPGTDFTDTWALDLGTRTWTKLSPGSSFIAEDADLVCDPARDRLLLWTYDPIAETPRLVEYRFGDALGWRSVTTTGTAPKGATLMGSTLDRGRERWLLFGSGDRATPGETGNLGLAWALDLATAQWSQVGDLDPGFAWDHVSGALDPVSDRLVVTGGRRWTDPPTWYTQTSAVMALALASGTRSTLATAGAPPAARWSPWVAYDPWRDALLVSGGGSVSVTGMELDAWTLDWGRRHVRLDQAGTVDTFVRLRWRAPDRAGGSLALWRRTGTGAWGLLGPVPVALDGTASYDDAAVTNGTHYGYRLVDPATPGTQPLFETWVRAGAGSAGVCCEGAGPLLTVLGVPVTGALHFTLRLTASTPVRCTLHDLAGRTVHTWELGARGPGVVEIDGGPLPDVRAGVYFLHARAGARAETRRVVVLH